MAIVDGKIQNALWWTDFIPSVFVPQTRRYADCLTDRLLPTFASVNDEAQRIYETALENSTDDPELGTEPAEAEAGDYASDMIKIRQGLVSLWTTGLFHLFEQQMHFLLRRELLHLREMREIEGDVSKYVRTVTLDETVRRLKTGAIDLEEFRSWSRLCELRKIANVVKHGDGYSSRDLATIRPDLFQSPTAREMGLPSLRGLHEFQFPVFGEGIHVMDDDYRRFADDVLAFWGELVDALTANAHS